MSRTFVLTLLSVLLFSFIGASTSVAQFTISGTVSGPGATPVANVDVFLHDDQGDPIGGFNTVTDSTGFYSFSGLPAATYGILFDPPMVTGLLPKFIFPFVVTGNTIVDATLEPGNILSGFILDTLGNPIFNIDLNVYDFLPDTVINTPGDNSDITGFYDVLIPDGTYRLRWRPTGGEKLVPVEIPEITITNDTTINVTMQAGVFVAGSVKQPNMTPVFNADLDFIVSSTGELIVTPSDNTDNNGLFQVLVPFGTYDIQVQPIFTDGLVPIEVLNVPITNDTSIAFTVSPGFVISGTLTDSNATPVAGADIDLRLTSTGAKLFTPQDNTDVSGNYQILALTGMYDVIFKPPVATRLAPISVDSVSVSSATVVNGIAPDGFLISGVVQNSTLVPVPNVDIDAKISSIGTNVFLTGDNTDASGTYGVVVVPGTYDFEFEPPLSRLLSAQLQRNVLVSSDLVIDINLDTGIVISGTVVDSAMVPVANVDVTAIVSSSGDTVFTPLDNTDLSGMYSILVPPENYKLVYIPEPPSTIVDTIDLTNVTIVNDTTINVAFQSGQPPCCIGIRGDVNNDGTDANILDLNFLVNRVFRGGPAPVCPEEGDVNSDGTSANILDLNFLVNRVFRGGPPPGPC